MSKEKLLKNAEVEWGLKVGPKSNQRQQTQALINILSQTIDQTREETIREVEEMLPKEMEAFYTGNLMADVLENDEKKGFNKCLREIKQSLINLRSK